MTVAIPPVRATPGECDATRVPETGRPPGGASGRPFRTCPVYRRRGPAATAVGAGGSTGAGERHIGGKIRAGQDGDEGGRFDGFHEEQADPGFGASAAILAPVALRSARREAAAP